MMESGLPVLAGYSIPSPFGVLAAVSASQREISFMRAGVSRSQRLHRSGLLHLLLLDGDRTVVALTVELGDLDRYRMVGG